MASLRVYTVSSGEVSEGTEVGRLALKGAGIEIPAIFVGEEGRGRSLGVLPVALDSESNKKWQNKEPVSTFFAEVGATKAGKPKLLQRSGADTQDSILVVFRTDIGFRGGNSHKGDRHDISCPERGKEMESYSCACDECGVRRPEEIQGSWQHPQDQGFKKTWEKFPGEVLVEGVIAQGTAGAMGNGRQLVAIMPKDIVFRTGYSGRLYGAPSAHYYKWDGEKLLALTWDERVASDLF